MKTRITELFGIKYPIVMAGMGLVGDARLTVAVSEAGGLGIFGAAFENPEKVRESIRWIKEHTDKPFGVNIMEGDPWEKEVAQIVREEGVSIIGHGKGNPKWLIDVFKDRKCIKMPTIGALKHAIRAEKDGVDAIVVQGQEGGGHTGYISTMVLLPMVASQVRVPVLAAGGFCDGKGLITALALGAEGIYMGTRLALTQESPIHEVSKKRYLETTAETTVMTPLVTGTRSRGIKNKLTDLVEKEGGRMPLRHAISSTFEIKKTFDVPLWKMLLGGLRARKISNVAFKGLGDMASGIPPYRKGVLEGDADWGWLPCGQVISRIHDIPACKELLDRIMEEAEEIAEKIKQSL